jgi:hypothetical protein
LKLNNQGVPTEAFRFSDNSGDLVENGTWTGALCQMQSGVADMWATDASVTLERTKGFHLTTLYMIGKYGALMKRQTSFSIDIKLSQQALIHKCMDSYLHFYLYISFDEWTRSYAGLIMRKERVGILEFMNVIAAERMPFVYDFIQSNQLNEKCQKHIFPVFTFYFVTPSYYNLFDHFCNTTLSVNIC